MKLFTKVVFIAVTIFLTAVISTGCASNKKESSQLEVGIKFGYDDTIKISANNPLIATIKNNGPAIIGELQIQVENSRNSKVMYAMPFEIAENAQKEIKMDVPVYTIQKEFDVDIKSGKKNLYEGKVKALKVLSPNQGVMAVITDTPDSYRFLENTTVAYIQDEYYAKSMAMSSKTVASDVYSPSQTKELEVLYFDSLDDLDSIEKLSYFDYIYMGHNQSLTISEPEEDALINWIEQGNCFIIETGTNYKKMNSILPSSLNPVTIDQVEKIDINNIYKNISLDQTVDVAVSNNINEEGYIAKEEGGAVIASATQIGYGNILTLMVNLGLEPLASWNKKAPFLSTIIQEVNPNINSDNYEDSSYRYMLDQIPEDKKAPYMMMIIVFLVYILLVAPISYIILKKIDKRDFAWIGIPILAVICAAVLYIFGGNTRYTKAITNSISILTVSENDNIMNVSTDMVIFNNNKDKLEVQWNPDEEIDFNDAYQIYYGGYYDDSSVEKNLTGKFTLGNPEKYEKYDTTLWSSCYLTAKKTIPFSQEGTMVHMEINGNDNIVNITAKNITPMNLKNAFIQWGQGYIYIGDLDPGQEKQVSKSLDELTAVVFQTFISNEMGIKQIDYNKKITPADIKGQRQFEFLMQRYVYNNYSLKQLTDNSVNFDKVKLCAVNNQVVGYDLLVNEDTTTDYATNIVEIDSTIQFDSGTEIQIPKGILLPFTAYYLDEQQTGGNFDYQSYDQFLRFYEEGLAQFTFNVPKAIELYSASVSFGDVYGEQDYYNSQNGVAATPKEDVIYSAYNVNEGIWEEVNKEADLDNRYVDSNGQIQLRVDLRTTVNKENEAQSSGKYSYTQMMKLPTISMKGMVK